MNKVFFLLLGLLIFNVSSSSGNFIFYEDSITEFYHIKFPGGLSQNSISFIAQDSTGQMWFATKNGIIKYDATTFDIFQYSPKKTNTISDNFVNTILVTKSGDVWCGTNTGANKYNQAANEFEKIPIVELKNSHINSIVEDNNGYIWFLDIKFIIRSL